VGSLISRDTGTVISIDPINTRGTVLTWVAGTLIDICFTVVSGEARSTVAGIEINVVNTSCAILAWV
jgi:hypothetical protein